MAKEVKNKLDLINHVAEVTGLGKKDVRKALEAEHAYVGDNLSVGNDIHIHGFVNFSTTYVDSRKGNNPQTRAPMGIPSYTTLRAKPTAPLKRKLNGKT